jgi:hypothetical protein
VQAGGAFQATLLAFAYAVERMLGRRRAGERGQAGETRFGQGRGIHLCVGIAQGALVGTAVAAGEWMEGQPEATQRLAVGPADPFGYRCERVVTGGGHRAHADGQEAGQPVAHPAGITRVRHLGQTIQQTLGRHSRIETGHGGQCRRRGR